VKARYVLPLLLLVPTLSSAQQPSRTYISSPLAQQQHLPFSSGVLAGNTLYIAGTTAVGPTSRGSLSPTQEARVVMNMVKHVVEQAGMTMDDVVSVQVFCTNLGNYAAFNSVYKTYFHHHYPARAFIGVSKLLFGARYEVMGIAVHS
jgi:2-iminobutanoate/2-iminopropanoate deaminase